MRNNELRIKFKKESTDPKILERINRKAFDVEIDTIDFTDDILHITFKKDMKSFLADLTYDKTDISNIESYEFPESIEHIGYISHNSIITGVTAQSEGHMVVANGTLVYVCTDIFEEKIEVPEGVTKLADGVFRVFSNLKKVLLPTSLEEIGDYAFAGTMLSSIKFPKKLKIIGAHAFENTSLSTVTIPDEVTQIKELAFNGCNKLKKVSLGKSVISIGDGVFTRCKNLSEFNGRYATEDKKFLVKDKTLLAAVGINAELVLPDYIEEIAPKTFYQSYYGVVHLPAGLKGIGSYAFYKSLLSVKNMFPEGLEYIGEYAFASCDVKRVVIPNSLSEIGEGVFSDCKICSFEGKYATSNANYLIKDNVLIAVSVDKSATGADLPKQVTVIGKGAFTSSSAENIELPEGIISIHEKAFKGKDYNYIKLPSTLKTIEDSAFDHTTIFEGTIEFKEGLLSIGRDCFNSVNLEVPFLCFPSTLKSIGTGCFSNACYGQHMTIEFNSLEVPEGINSSPYSYPSPVTIRLPELSKEKYLSSFSIFNLYIDRFIENDSNIKFEFKD